jgi:lysozyme family protein
MADFEPAFQRTMRNEGGFVLHTVPGDRGGMTYAGIARNAWPKWAGWSVIDAGQTPETEHVRHFYMFNFWRPLSLDHIQNQTVAQTIFDFGVNAGIGTSAKLAQIVAGSTPDGKVGPKTISAINETDPDLFVARYALAKLARYRDIITRDRSQIKFALGWINRLLKEAAQ